MAFCSQFCSTVSHRHLTPMHLSLARIRPISGKWFSIRVKDFYSFSFWGEGGFSLFVFLILQGGFASCTKQFKNGNWDSDVLPDARTSTKMSPVNWQARSKWQTLIHGTSFWKSNTSLKDLTACLLHFEMLDRDFHRYTNLAEPGGDRSPIESPKHPSQLPGENFNALCCVQTCTS